MWFYYKNGNFNAIVSYVLCKNGLPILGFDWKPAIGPIWFLPCFVVSHVYYKYTKKLGDIWCAIVLFLLFELSLFISSKIGMLPFELWQAIPGAIFIFIGASLRKNKVIDFIMSKWSVLFGLGCIVVCAFKGSLIMTSHIYKYNVLQFIAALYATIFLYKAVKYIPFRALEYIGKFSLYTLCFHTIDYKIGISRKIAWHISNNTYEACIWIFLLELCFCAFCLFVKHVVTTKINHTRIGAKVSE